MTPAEIADQLAAEARASGAYPSVPAVGARYGLDERQAGRILMLVRARWRPLLPPTVEPVPDPPADAPTVPDPSATASPVRAEGADPPKARRKTKKPATPTDTTLDGTLRQLVTEGLGLTLSPGQGLIVDAADGAEIPHATDDGVRTAERGGAVLRTRERLGVPARQICVVAGIRGGKTTLAACAAVAGALRADLSSLRADETAAGLIVAPHADSASETYRVLRELVEGHPALTALLVGEPKASRLTLRRPSDGRRVELRVVAAGKGGLTLRSRWLTSCVLDEGAFFESASTAAVTDRAQLDAVRHRVVPGAQIWLISSPFAAKGLLHDVWRTTAPGWVVVHAPSSALHPKYWTPERVQRALAEDYESACREVLGQFVDAATSLFSTAAVERASKHPVSPPVPHRRYVAAMDPASRVNPWTVAVATRGPQRFEIVAAREWVPRGSDLDPDEVLAELSKFLAPYGVTTVLTDQYGYASTAALARRYGLALTLHTTTDRTAMQSHLWLKKRLEADEVALPPIPELLADMQDVQRVLGSGGRARVEYQRRGPRHADYVPAVVLALAALRDAPPADDEAAKLAAEEAEEAELPGLKRARVNPAMPWASR